MGKPVEEDKQGEVPDKDKAKNIADADELSRYQTESIREIARITERLSASFEELNIAMEAQGSQLDDFVEQLEDLAEQLEELSGRLESYAIHTHEVD